MATVKVLYPAGTFSSTIAPANVASSPSFTAGVKSDPISNVSNLDLDHQVTGVWTVGNTGVGANTQAQVWVIPALTNDLGGTLTWPDVFGGTAAASTVTSAGVLQGAGRLGAVVNIDSTTNNRSYPYAFSVAPLFGGYLPTAYQFFITHNSSVASNATSSNFQTQIQRIQATVA